MPQSLATTAVITTINNSTFALRSMQNEENGKALSSPSTSSSFFTQQQQQTQAAVDGSKKVREKNYAKVVNFLSLKSYLLSRIICLVSHFDFGAAREEEGERERAKV
jgi:hypothetical protein